MAQTRADLPTFASLTMSQSSNNRAVNQSNNQSLKVFVAGGFAGGISRTIVAPFDRIKILMQTQQSINQSVKQSVKQSVNQQSHTTRLSAVNHSVTTRNHSHLSFNQPSNTLIVDRSHRSVWSLMHSIKQSEGVLSLWRGNVINVARVIPYSAIQFACFDWLKSSLNSCSNHSNTNRMIAGAFAGMVATMFTHPMDLIRTRQCIDQTIIHSSKQSSVNILKELIMERKLMLGIVPSMLSVAPFIAINLTLFDYLNDQSVNQSMNHTVARTLAIGAVSGMVAQSICYPLDTIRRRMQVKQPTHNPSAKQPYQYQSAMQSIRSIYQTNGLKGFYRGVSVNAIKIGPQQAIRFVAFDWATRSMGVAAKSKY